MPSQMQATKDQVKVMKRLYDQMKVIRRLRPCCSAPTTPNLALLLTAGINHELNLIGAILEIEWMGMNTAEV